MFPDLTVPESRQCIVFGHDTASATRLQRILTGLGFADGALICARSSAELVQLPKHLVLALALIDTGLHEGDDVVLVQALKAFCPSLPVMVLAASHTDHQMLGLLRMGAAGYVLKERKDEEVTFFIRSALSGGTPIDPLAARCLLSALNERLLLASVPSTPAPAPVPARTKDILSPREVEILGFAGRGMSNREISCQLSLSLLTVESHMKTIYRKLAVNRRTQAIFEARARGLLP